ncbi:MAG: hypothetical protein WA139_00660 [Candidatus Aenigmatarchaeota archaeon]
MKDWEKQLLNEGFDRLDKTLGSLRKKKSFIETIGEGDLVFIKNNNAAGNGLSYLGYVGRVVGLCSSMQNYVSIPVDFEHGRCKILTFEKGKIDSASDAEPAYQGNIYDSSILHKGEGAISSILEKKYKTNLKEIGLE